MLPLWAGAWGPLSTGSAISTTVLIIFGICIAVALNEYLVKVSDMDWEYMEGRWKIVLPVLALLIGANLMTDSPAAKRVAMAVGFGLIGLTATRAQSQTDVLMRIGIFLALGAAFWGLAGKLFFWCIPLLLILALQLTYDPPESRAYLSWRDHGQLALIILGLSAGILAIYLVLGVLLHLMGVELNPAKAPAFVMERAAATTQKHQIKWWDFVVLAAMAYFLLPYLIRFFSEKQEVADAPFENTDSAFHRIAEQFKKALGRQSPRERIIYSYHEMLKALIKLGFPHDVAATPQEIAESLTTERGIPAPLCESINDLFYRACYHDEATNEFDATTMEELTPQIIVAYRE
ncbi:DUF4129 domain-containing protein [Cerasicoccus frondis]|uniref:DUF4129 domain-containing protein n=1 Tax=Cerasicoccus frondis TaxID=490090 RepID=UPI0028525C62|nr:DUF4129 domain-containing protein [Cerasicoccus frondis]